MATFDFGPKPSWVGNPPKGFMVTTAEAPTDNPFLGFEKANMQAFTKFMEDRGYQTGAIRGLDTNREVWYDNETGTAYTLSDTSNATISGGKKLPPKKADKKTVSPPRPFEPVRELDRDADLRESVREYNRERRPEIIKEALEQPTVDLAGLEPGSRKAAPTRPSALIRERRASEDPLTDAISDDSDDVIDTAGLEPPTGTQRSASQDRIVGRDSAMLGMPTQSTTVRQDDQLTERLVGDIQPQFGSVRGAVRAAELQRRADLPPEEETIRRGTTRSGRVIQGSKPGLFETEYTQKRGRVGRGRNKALIYGGQQNAESAPSEQFAFMQPGRDVDIIGMDEAARTADKPRGLPTLERDITDPDMTDDTVTADAEEVELDLEGMAPPQQTLLQRIGNALKNNPELAASGVQLFGGLLSNAAQNRAQRRADRTTDQRVARANLISAITGGRARPTVERAQADTGGFMSLDTLGKALQGGGAAVKGELSRRGEEAERERKAGLDERAAELAEAQAESLDAYRKGTLGQREKEFNAQQELLKKQAEQALAEQGEVNLTQLRANVKDVDDGLGLRKTGGYLDSSQGPKKLYNDMRVLFRQFEEDPNSANIMGIIQVYQRLFDPATVREGDVALMREAEGRIKQAVALAERVIGDGGVVSSYTIEDMKKAADDVHAMQLAKAKADVRAYTSRLFSANERKVLDEYYDDILSVRELPGEGEGTFISDLSGASLDLD